MVDISREYRNALLRVTGRPFSRTHVARWLIGFSFRDIEGLPKHDQEAVQQEGQAFFYGERYPTQQPLTATIDVRQKVVNALIVRDHPEWRGHFLNPLPSVSDLIQLQDWLRSLWDDLKTGLGKSIVTSGWTAHLSVTATGALGGTTSPQASSWLERFQLRTVETLLASEVRKHFRFCKSEVCRRPFLSVKRQAFCSTACSQRHRTANYRTKNREQFRLRRREAYARKQREKTGLPNLKIQTKKGAPR